MVVEGAREGRLASLCNLALIFPLRKTKHGPALLITGKVCVFMSARGR